MPMSSQEVLARLVGFPTISDRSNLELIEYVEALLGRYGARCVRVPNGDGSKASLYASIGPMVAGGVVLSSHSDVVPVAGQAWTTDPFILAERDGRLYGRGTTDMKGFLAAGLAALPRMQAAELARPIHFAISYDEELGCLGAPDMIAAMAGDLPPPAAVLVGEPTLMQVVTCHKGCLDLTTTVTGKAIHSSLNHRGVSAISVAARLIGWLDARQAQMRAAAAPDSPFEPGYTTFHCGVIQGGNATNIVAQHCAFSTDIRTVDSDDVRVHLAAYRDFIASEIVPAMRAIAPECGVEVSVDAEIPVFRRETGSAAEALARRLTGDNGFHVKSGGTEAGQFQQAGFSTVICGPGSMEQAHQPDEFITLEQLAAADQFIERLVEEMCR